MDPLRTWLARRNKDQTTLIRRVNWLGPVLISIAVATGACHLIPGGRTHKERENQLAHQPKAQRDVVPPPGIDEKALTPLEGAALRRAQLTLTQIIEQLPQVDYLREDTQYDNFMESPPPSLAAQLAYVAGRQAWNEKRTAEAKRQLELALRVAPKRAAILRLLGQIYTYSGNRVRGAYYLKQAVEIDPRNIESLFLLGRFALEQKKWSEAIAILHFSLEKSNGQCDPALAGLIPYYLSIALMQNGYAQAAINQTQYFLDNERRLRQPTRYARELIVRTGKAPNLWVRIGDLHHKLNRPNQAIGAYELADGSVRDESGLARRLIYTYLRLGLDEKAQQRVIRQINRSADKSDVVRLVQYLIDHDIRAADLAKQIKSAYLQENRPESLALAIVDLLPHYLRSPLLTEHLSYRPQDRQVFDRWLELTLPQGAASASRSELETAIDLTGTLMLASPQFSEHYVQILLKHSREVQSLIVVFDLMSPQKRNQPTMLVLYGMVLVRSGQIGHAKSHFEQAITADPELDTARLQLAKVLMLSEQFAEADKLLNTLAHSINPSVVNLRVQVLIATGQTTEALDLIKQVLDQDIRDTRLVLQKALLHRNLRQTDAAEQTLLDAIKTRPTEEVLYEALFDLYEAPDRPRHSTQRRRQLLDTMAKTIPHSRISRLKLAEVLIQQHEFEKAEQLLRHLIAQNSDDARAISQLLEAFIRSGHHDKAIKLVEQKLAEHANDRTILQTALNFFVKTDRQKRLVEILEQRLAQQPDDRSILLLALAYYNQIGETGRAIILQERVLLQEPQSPSRAVYLATLYIKSDRPIEAIEEIKSVFDQAEPVHARQLLMLRAEALWQLGREEDAHKQITQAQEKFVADAPEIGYLWSVILSQKIGDRKASEQVMIELLGRFPDHPAINNDLAYNWTVENRNLDQAKHMIEKAIQAEGQNSAYLDSLGWVHYKLGRFKEAESWLRKSRTAQDGKGENPVIIDHLGDTLYRLGRPIDATRAWSDAKALLSTRPRVHANDLELIGLEQRLVEKIEAVRQKREAPVAKLPDEEREDEPQPHQPICKPAITQP